jgi:hypothetical protein
VFVYDNATTHLKQLEGALSAHHMHRGISENWGVEVTEKNPVTGKPVYHSDGKLSKVKVRMGPAKFADGSPQDLYFPEGHPKAGYFKGMDIILQEHGIDTSHVKFCECTSFKCTPHATDCCVHRILFNQPDFVHIESILEARCKSQGIQVVFLPKFHCKLNPIEQCWGYAKQLYHFYPESKREDDLHRNALEALDGVPIHSIHR